MMLQITDPKVGLDRWLLAEVLTAEGMRTRGLVPSAHMQESQNPCKTALACLSI